jgi:hypothetical protein
MSECTNPDVQDVLPEFVAGALSASERLEVELHLSACAGCREDLAVLELVRRVRPAAPALDVATIVAALPSPAGVRPEGPSLRVVTASGGAPTVPDRRSRRPVATPAWWRGTGLRAAAALTLIALGGLSVEVARRGGAVTADGAGRVIVTEASLLMADLPAREGPWPYADDAVPIVPVVAVAPSVLPIQELPDYSEEELTLLLERIERWDGALAVEAIDPAVPPPGDTMKEGTR